MNRTTLFLIGLSILSPPVPAPEFVDESHDEGCECRTSRKETAVCDCDEPAPVPEGEGEVPNCIWMIHDGNPTSWNYCPNCGAYLKAAAPPVGTQE